MRVRTTGRKAANIAAAICLVGAGSFLVYGGVTEYLGAAHAQTEAAQEWKKVADAGSSRDESPEMGAVFSRIEVPRLHRSLYVVEGSNPESLKKGPGHVRGTAMPGELGNCVIAAHRDLHFRFLKDIHIGDGVVLETSSGRFRYRVTGTKIIPPTQISVLQPTPDAELHLITCYPFYYIGHAPKRFVVTAKLQEREDNRPSSTSGL